MQIEKALVQEIKDDATLAALLLRSGTEYHIYPVAVPRNYMVESDDNACYLVYNRIGTQFNQKFGFQIAAYQISVFTKKYAKAVQARDALFNAIQRFKGQLGSSGNTQLTHFAWMTNNLELKDPESDEYHMVLECSFKYSEE